MKEEVKIGDMWVPKNWGQPVARDSFECTDSRMRQVTHFSTEPDTDTESTLVHVKILGPYNHGVPKITRVAIPIDIFLELHVLAKRNGRYTKTGEDWSECFE